MADDHDFLFKLAVIGNKNVGKSSLLNRFCCDTFDDRSISTIGVDFKLCNIVLGEDFHNKRIKLQLWDTAGEERYKSLTSVYYRNADAVIVVFDVTSRQTLDSVVAWLDAVNRFCGPNVHTVLVGNKCDLEQTIEDSEIEDFSYTYNLNYILTSAKDNTNTRELFVKICEDLVVRTDQLLSLHSVDRGPESIFLKQKEDTPTYCCAYY